MGGGIVGTVTAGERVNSTGPQVAGLFFAPATFRERRCVIFSASNHAACIRSGLRPLYSWHVQVVFPKLESERSHF
jgi:hypothetical protein